MAMEKFNMKKHPDLKRILSHAMYVDPGINQEAMNYQYCLIAKILRYHVFSILNLRNDVFRIFTILMPSWLTFSDASVINTFYNLPGSALIYFVLISAFILFSSSPFLYFMWLTLYSLFYNFLGV